MSRTSLWTSVNRLCSCLSRQPWSPATPQVHYCILMWFAARGAERPPGSYRDWIIYKVLQYCPGDLYNAQALFLYAVLCRFDVNTLWASSSFHKGSWKNMFQGHKHHLVGNLSGLKKKTPCLQYRRAKASFLIPHFPLDFQQSYREESIVGGGREATFSWRDNNVMHIMVFFLFLHHSHKRTQPTWAHKTSNIIYSLLWGNKPCQKRIWIITQNSTANKMLPLYRFAFYWTILLKSLSPQIIVKDAVRKYEIHESDIILNQPV